MAWMANAESHDRLSGLLGKYNVSWAAGILSGFYLAGVTFTRFGWQSGFYFSAALGALLFLFILLCEPHGGGGAPAEASAESEHGLHAHEVSYYVRQGLLMLTAGQFLSSLVLYMFPKIVGDEVHESGQSLLNVAKMAGQVLAFLVFGHTTGWHYRRWPLLVCAGSMALGILLVASGHRFPAYTFGSVLLGWGFGIAFTMSAFYALGLSESKGQASGTMETLIGGSSVAGPLYGGVIGRWTTARGGVLAGLLPLAVSFGFSIVKGANIRRLVAKQSAGSS
jgi:MFS family permease